MRVTLSDSIRIAEADLDPRIRDGIQAALTIDNPQKALALREHLWNAERMDDHLRLYSFDPVARELLLPMGFIHALQLGCLNAGVALSYDDRRSFGTQLMCPQAVELRDYQEPMSAALIQQQIGIGEAPTGAGKTAVALGSIQRVGRSAVIIVEKASLADQWAGSIRSMLGIEPGYVGEGELSIQPLTIALRAAIHARRDELEDQGFFDAFGVAVVDECHHAATAWTLIEMIQRFTSFYRWGISATPERDPAYYPVLQAVLGPIVWETTIEDAGEHLMKPSVQIIESDFEFEFRPTELVQVEAKGGGTRTKVERNNYNSLIKAAVTDGRRNAQIAAKAAMEARAGHHILIVSQQVEHLRLIHDCIGDGDVLVHELTGKVGDYETIRHTIETADCGSILLSTVADEGLSIDRLDRVIIAYPRRNPETIRQIAGRVMRPWPGKTDAKIIDVRDGNQPVLRTQFRDRAQMLYHREGWEIER
jgi:superfamily II DNA or RNA helicase